MRIAQSVNELSRLEIDHLGNHQREQGIAGDVEWNAKEHISAALIKLAGKTPFRNIELKQRVTGWKRHLGDVCGIPSDHHVAARLLGAVLSVSITPVS